MITLISNAGNCHSISVQLLGYFPEHLTGIYSTKIEQWLRNGREIPRKFEGNIMMKFLP